MLEKEFTNVAVGDKFRRYATNPNGKKIEDGILTCSYLNKNNYFFECNGCSDFPESYVIKVPIIHFHTAFPYVERIK